jgi:hypothetical protein
MRKHTIETIVTVSWIWILLVPCDKPFTIAYIQINEIEEIHLNWKISSPGDKI